MPFVNAQGRIAHGRFPHGACLDNVKFDEGGEACWFNDNTIIYIHEGVDGRYLAFYDINTQEIRSVNTPPAYAEAVLGSKYSQWAAWNPTDKVFSSIGFYSEGALLAIGPDGSVCYRDGETVVHQPNGVEYPLSADPTEDVAVVGDGQAIWHNGGAIQAVGMPSLKVVGTDAAGITQPKAVVIGGKWWLCYLSSTHGMVLHPSDDVKGYLLPGDLGFDIALLNDHVLRYAYATATNEGPGQVAYLDIDTTLTPPTLDPGVEVPGEPPPGEPTITAEGVMTLTSSATFDIVPAAEELVTLPIEVLPAYPQENGHGRLVHPTLGAFDYEVKPDEWVNIDTDAIVAPIWSSSRTLTGAANVLWSGNIRDVVVEERWKAVGGMSMPITQLRMLLAIWTNPVDPDVGYVQWFPNYISGIGFSVLPVSLQSGGGGITFDDVVNYKDENGELIGWMTNPVTFTLKLVERL